MNKSRKGKYIYNESFFEYWSHDMAYILGFITADGSVNNYSLRIEIQERDSELLEFIKRKIAPISPITERILNGRKYIRLNINNIAILNSLKKFNIIPNKTKRLSVSFKIPLLYISDYIRSFFDGDGWVTTRRNSIECGMCSVSKEFLKQLQVLLKIDGGNFSSQIKANSTMPLWRWQLYSNNTILFRDFIYQNNGFSLKRKKDKFYSNFHIPSPRWWTEDQIHYLKQHFGIQKVRDMVPVIKKSYRAIYKKIWELELCSQN